MDELESKVIGNITFQLMKRASHLNQQSAQFIKIEWSADLSPLSQNSSAPKTETYFDIKFSYDCLLS